VGVGVEGEAGGVVGDEGNYDIDVFVLDGVEEGRPPHHIPPINITPKHHQHLHHPHQIHLHRHNQRRLLTLIILKYLKSVKIKDLLHL